VAVLAAGMVAALLAVPTTWVIFRLKGAYFAIGTWVVAEVYRLVFAQVSPTFSTRRQNALFFELNRRRRRFNKGRGVPKSL
jgi:ABC-type branched-subunit amino acid transport system permease subunit